MLYHYIVIDDLYELMLKQRVSINRVLYTIWRQILYLHYRNQYTINSQFKKCLAYCEDKIALFLNDNDYQRFQKFKQYDNFSSVIDLIYNVYNDYTKRDLTYIDYFDYHIARSETIYSLDEIVNYEFRCAKKCDKCKVTLREEINKFKINGSKVYFTSEIIKHYLRSNKTYCSVAKDKRKVLDIYLHKQAGFDNFYVEVVSA